MHKNCTIKKLCVASLTEEECNSAITINPQTTRCIFNNQENICEIKEICELEENPSLTKCELILTSSNLIPLMKNVLLKQLFLKMNQKVN